MDTNELNNLSLNKLLIREYYAAIYPSDKLPNTLLPFSFYILNLDPSDKPGSHWILISTFQCPKYVDYICSFGSKPEKQNMISSMKSIAQNIHYNDIPLQSPFTTVC